MKNNAKNRVVIIDADRPRVLKASHKALKMMTKMLNKPVDEIELDASDFDKLEIIVYCLCLKDAQKNGEKLTVDMMEDILDACDTEQDIIDAVADAFEAAFPQVTNQAKNSQAVTQVHDNVAPVEDGIGMQA